jgi:mannosyltransferase OCH1-like enzyme
MLLQKAVERADFFRYLIVLKYGGLYADTDVQCMSPVDRWALVPPGSVRASPFSHSLVSRTQPPLSSALTHQAMVVGIEAEFPTAKEAFQQTFARQRQVNPQAPSP